MRWALPIVALIASSWLLGYDSGKSTEREKWRPIASDCLDLARRTQRVGRMCIDEMLAHQHSESERCFCFSPVDGGTF